MVQSGGKQNASYCQLGCEKIGLHCLSAEVVVVGGGAEGEEAGTGSIIVHQSYLLLGALILRTLGGSGRDYQSPALGQVDTNLII